MASNLQSGHNEKLQKLVEDFFLNKKPKKLTILVTGKTGVGKSRLVNALVGENVAKEGQKKVPCTSEVSLHKVIKEGVEVTVCDSPGLQDGTGNEELYIQDMKEKIKNIDLMIYCINMDDKRFYDADKKAIRTLTDEFGKEVWEHAVVALTFANKVKDPDKGNKLQYFGAQLQEWKQELENHFKVVSPELRIPPVIPAGNQNKMRLPDRENWLPDLWIGCYEAMKASARQAMYRINRHRLRTSGDTRASQTTPHSTADTSDNSEAESQIPKDIPLQDRHIKSFFETTLEGILTGGGAALQAAGAAGGTALRAAGAVGGMALRAARTVGGATLKVAEAVGGAALTVAGVVAPVAITMLELTNGKADVRIGKERITFDLSMLDMKLFEGSYKYRDDSFVRLSTRRY